jgi:hypothetical protein
VTVKPRKTHAGFTYDPGLLTAAAVEKITDRALLALVVSLTPGYLTSGGVPRTKTGKAREIENAELYVLLRLMVNDFDIRAGDGYTETALWGALGRLGVERGVLAEQRGSWTSASDHGPWSLWDVMTDDRRDRLHPGRRTSARGRAPRYAGPRPQPLTFADHPADPAGYLPTPP